MDGAGETETRRLKFFQIGVKELEEEVGGRGLLRVFQTNTQLIGIGRRKIKGKNIIIAHGLNELVKVNHVDTHHELAWAIELGELVGVKTHEDHDSMRLVHIENTDPLWVKLQVRLHENFLQRLNQVPKNGALCGFELKEVAVGIWHRC